MEEENKVVKIALVEDSDEEASNILGIIESYGQKRGIAFSKQRFRLATDFLETAATQYDVVFMDIQLPDLDGMRAAKKLRETDKNVILVFVTNFAQYAINGYEVDAADFIVKPVEPVLFCSKMDRILARIDALTDITLPVKTADGMVSVKTSELKYVEVLGHGLIYHTTHGDVRASGTLYRVEARLKEAHFVRCNSCYLVNLRYVEALNGYTAIVGGQELKISHNKKKEFRQAIAVYFGGLL